MGSDIMESNLNEVLTSFDDLNLKEDLLKGIYACGFEKPLGIQQRGIRPCISGRDVIALAQPGYGKTALICISILQLIDTSVQKCQALLLVPTRTIGLEIEKLLFVMGYYIKVKFHVLDSLPQGDIKTANDAHVLIGTPGKINRLLRQNALEIKTIKAVFLDEADRIRTPKKIREVLNNIGQQIQVILLSDAMSMKLFNVAFHFTRTPVQIVEEKETLSLEGKESNNFSFMSRRKTGNLIHSATVRLGSGEVAAFGCNEMSKKKRDMIMEQFNLGFTRVLVTTDLLSRGIDGQEVSLIINYDIPTAVVKYIERIGRGGQFSIRRAAINFVSKSELPSLTEIAEHFDTYIQEMPSNVGDFI